MYVSPGNGSAVRMNANLLLIHAVAARAGHDGAARQDARARALLETLTRAPSSVLAAGEDTSDPTRSVCWTRDLGSHRRDHRSSDPQVTEALALAWRARRALGVPGPLAARVGRRDRPLRPAARVALPARRRQPVQLERAALRGRGRRDRAPRPAARRLPPLPAPLRRRDPAAGPRHGGRQPRAGLRRSATRPASRPAHGSTSTRRSTRTSSSPACAGMRAPCGRACGRCRPPTGACCAPGSRGCSPGRGRMRATSTGTPATAPGRWHSGQYWAFAQQGLLAIAAAPGAVGEPRLRPLGEGAVRPRPAALRPVGARGRRAARAADGLRRVLPAPRLQPLRHAHGRERHARGRGGPGRDAGRGPAAALRVRPGHRAARGDHAALLDRDRARQPRGVRLRRDRPRAAVRPRPARRGRRSAASRRTRSG